MIAKAGKYVKEVFVFPPVFKVGIASFDQALMSAANLAVSIILIKYGAKSEYGYYSIAFAGSLFVLSLQNAIVTTPLSVLLATKGGKEKRCYPGSLCIGQFIVVVPGVIVGLGIVGLLYWAGYDLSKSKVACALCFALIGIVFREFMRSYYFANESPLEVLKIDLCYVVGYLVLVIVTCLFAEIGAATIFGYMGISGFVVAAVSSRDQGWKVDSKSIRKSYKENWRYGKWALLGVVVTHIQSYSYLYLLGALVGSLAVAEVSAARLLIMPLMLIRAGWGKVVMPYGARLREAGELKRFVREQVLISGIIVFGIVVYVCLLLGFSEILRNLVLTEKYGKAFDVLTLWGAIAAVGVVVSGASFGLQVVKEFQLIAKVNIVTMVVTILSSYWLIKSYGIEGGLVSLLIGNALLGGALWCSFIARVFSGKRTDEVSLESAVEMGSHIIN